MNIKKHYSILILLLFSSLCAQNIQLHSYAELRNAFILGLDETGLEIGLEVISKAEYKKDRENGLKLLGDYFLYKAISEEEKDLNFAKRAYAMYSMFVSDYPNSKNIKIVILQVEILKNLFKDLELFGELYSEYSTEASLVNELYEYGNLYELYSDEKPLTGWQLLLQTQSKFQVANKYYDTIILNYPKYEVYGYYLKAMSYINNYKRWTTDTEWHKKIGLKNRTDIYNNTIIKVDYFLGILDKKYPKSNYTLDAHFTLAGHLWNNVNKNLNKKERKEKTKYHLEKILENDKDILGMRYVLTKEFVIRNF